MASRRYVPRYTESDGPALPPGWWNLAGPTPVLEVINQPTAGWNRLMPSAVLTPPTFTAPFWCSARTAAAMYPAGSRDLTSTRTMTGYRDARRATFSALGILPDGFATTLIRGSRAAMSLATCSVRSFDGPTASTTSSSPG